MASTCCCIPVSRFSFEGPFSSSVSRRFQLPDHALSKSQIHTYSIRLFKQPISRFYQKQLSLHLFSCIVQLPPLLSVSFCHSLRPSEDLRRIPRLLRWVLPFDFRRLQFLGTPSGHSNPMVSKEELNSARKQRRRESERAIIEVARPTCSKLTLAAFSIVSYQQAKMTCGTPVLVGYESNNRQVGKVSQRRRNVSIASELVCRRRFFLALLLTSILRRNYSLHHDL